MLFCLSDFVDDVWEKEWRYDDYDFVVDLLEDDRDFCF